MPARDMPEDLPALNFGGYLARLPEQVMLGASYDFTLSDRVLERAHCHNLALLPEQLHHLIDTDISGWQGRVANSWPQNLECRFAIMIVAARLRGCLFWARLAHGGLHSAFFWRAIWLGKLRGGLTFYSAG